VVHDARTKCRALLFIPIKFVGLYNYFKAIYLDFIALHQIIQQAGKIMTEV